jgi:hypothetical protein
MEKKGAQQRMEESASFHSPSRAQDTLNAQQKVTHMAGYGALQEWMIMETMSRMRDNGVTVVQNVKLQK